MENGDPASGQKLREEAKAAGSVPSLGFSGIHYPWQERPVSETVGHWVSSGQISCAAFLLVLPQLPGAGRWPHSGTSPARHQLVHRHPDGKMDSEHLPREPGTYLMHHFLVSFVCFPP